MSPEDIMVLVLAMRVAQKKHARTKTGTNLYQAMQLESQLDRVLEQFFSSCPIDEQPKLF